MAVEPYIDAQRVRHAFERAAARFDQDDFLHAEIRRRLSERLDFVRLDPRNVLDLGAGTMGAAGELGRRFPQSLVTAVDFSAAMLAAGHARHDRAQPVCADAARLPLADASFGLVFSNLMLHYCADLPAALGEIRRVLDYPGLFCFTTFGPDTLMELRAAFGAADEYAHVLPFMDMHDLGDLLVASGFAEPVVDRENLVIRYSSIDQCIADLRAAGSINAAAGRSRGLTGCNAWRQMASRLDAARDDEGRFAITLELVYGKAWSTPSDGGDPFAGRRLDMPVEVQRSEKPRSGRPGA